MNRLIRALIAGYGAKKLGGGCLGTILVFIIIYYALGTCNSRPVQTYPNDRSQISVPVSPAQEVAHLDIRPVIPSRY